MATQEELKKSEAERKRLEKELADAHAAQKFDPSEARSWLGLAGDIFGGLFSWGIPLAIFGTILVAASGPIAALIKTVSPDMAEKFQAFTGYIKEEYLRMTPSTEETAALEAEANKTTPEEIQSIMTEKMGVSPALAQAIVPDENAKQELFTFMKSQGISPRNPERMNDPAVLARFIQEKPNTMLRVVNAMPAGGMAALPAPLKEALKATLGDPQTLARMVAESSPHKAWIQAAITKMADGKSDKVQGKLLELAGTNPDQIAPLLGRLIDGDATAEAELSKLVADHLSPTERAAEVISAYEKAKSDGYGALLTALENADPNFKAEAVAALTENPDESKIAETLLPIIILNPTRLAALKGLTNEQLAPVMASLKTISPEMEKPEVRDAMLGAVAKLAQTNSAGNNELGDTLRAAITTPANAIPLLTVYITEKPERIAALKGLPNEALAPLMVPLSALSPLMAIPAARDAMLNAVAKLAQTNSEGNNELGNAVIAAASATNSLERAAILTEYINANPDRKKALNQLKTQLEAMKARGAQDEATATPYADFIAQIDAILTVSPKQAAAAAAAVETAPEPVQDYFASLIENPTVGLQRILSDDGLRAQLQQSAEAGSARNSVLLGDALAGLDIARFPEHAAMLRLLTKKNAQGIYPNLEALLQAADAIDKETGWTADDVKVYEDAETALNAATTEAERTKQQNIMNGVLLKEQAADAANIKNLSILMALGQKDGIKLVPEQAADVPADEKKYQLTSNPDVTFSASELAQHFANDKDGKPNANIVAFAQLAKTLKKNNPDNPVLAALAEHFWNDKNGDQKVDDNEGFASVLFDPANLQNVLAMQANGGKQGRFDAVLTSLIGNLPYLDIITGTQPLLSLISFKEVVDQQLAPVPTPTTGPVVVAAAR